MTRVGVRVRVRAGSRCLVFFMLLFFCVLVFAFSWSLFLVLCMVVSTNDVRFFYYVSVRCCHHVR
jgi:hypothetical protein